MSSNYVQPGDTLTLTAPYTRTAGQGALVGTIFGVAEQDVLITVEGEFSVVGVWDLAKSATSTYSFSQGDPVYWDDTNKICTPTDADGPLIGYAVQDASAAATTVRVRLNGTTCQ